MAAKVPLGVRGKVPVEQGEVGEVMKVLRDQPEGVIDDVHFPGRNSIQVPDAALELPGDPQADREKEA